MRYAVIEVLPVKGLDGFRQAKVQYVACDLCLSSANDCIKAWGYQAGVKGGWMERIEDTPEAFDKRVDELNRYAFKGRDTI